MPEDFTGCWVGPMPVKGFTDAFFPLSSSAQTDKPQFCKTYFDSLQRYTEETDANDSMAESISASGSIPGFKIFNTSSAELDKANDRKKRPDLMTYRYGIDTKTNSNQFEEAEIAFEIRPFGESCDPFQDSDHEECEDSKGSAEDDDEEQDGSEEEYGDEDDEDEDEEDQDGTEGNDQNSEKNDGQFQGAVSETEESEQLTVFQFEAPAKSGKQCRYQIVYYANMILARQHRTHCFVVWMGDPWARLIRMDRDGGIVSARFNYRERSDLLLEFLWRYSTASDVSRGKDPSVRRAGPEDSALAQQKLSKWMPKEAKVRVVYEMTISDTSYDVSGKDWPLEDLDNDDTTNGNESRHEALDEHKPRILLTKIMRVLVWAPFAEPESVRGKATRVYPGYDPDSDRIVLVKDAWRPLALDIQKETETLRILNDASVRNVPILLCGDDIQGQWQQTVTHAYSNESWNIGGVAEAFQQRQHIRFATDKVGFPLGSFSRSKTMVTAICDALIAHKDAFERCRILHRDISVANILINRDKDGGFLNDWDLARNVDDLQKGARQPQRSGTWAFMSAHLLSMPCKMHTLQDDLESIFWVVLYVIMRYMGYKVELEHRLQDIVNIFFQHTTRNGESHGGAGKRDFMGYHLSKFVIPDNVPLTDLLSNFRRMIQHFHHFMERMNHEFGLIMFDNENVNIPDGIRAASMKLNDDFQRLEIRNYDAIETLFTNALSHKKWPKDDKAFDHYAKALSKRKLAEIEYAKEGGMAAKRLKGNRSKGSKKNLD